MGLEAAVFSGADVPVVSHSSVRSFARDVWLTRRWCPQLDVIVDACDCVAQGVNAGLRTTTLVEI